MIPKDPDILLSVINTALRDNYPDISEYCADKDISINDIDDILNPAGYFYNKETNSYTAAK